MLQTNAGCRCARCVSVSVLANQTSQSQSSLCCCLFVDKIILKTKMLHFKHLLFHLATSLLGNGCSATIFLWAQRGSSLNTLLTSLAECRRALHANFCSVFIRSSHQKVKLQVEMFSTDAKVVFLVKNYFLCPIKLDLQEFWPVIHFFRFFIFIPCEWIHSCLQWAPWYHALLPVGF